MGLIATMSTFPERRQSFETVVDCILNRQSRPVDRLIVFLYRYGEIDPTLPSDPRLDYRIDRGGAGPWIRYTPADELEDDDILLTLDDDTFYPEDYVERGLAELLSVGLGWAVTFGGIVWDPLGAPHTYMQNCWRFIASDAQDRNREVAFHMGLVSFFRARDVKRIICHDLPGFNTNDDMMIAYGLQRRGVRIRCLRKPANWIRDLETAHAEHALYRRDIQTRYRVFTEMVSRLGFEPTAGELARYRGVTRRLLVLADVAPPLPGTEELDAALRSLCAEGCGVHVLAPVPASKIPDVMFRVNAPYEVHAVSVPEPGGRLDSLPPVRAWRNWRIDREARRKWAQRERLARERLAPTEVFRFEGGHLVPEGAA
jgi:Glycosyl transferase family group 2